jgi:hypothetical protein
MWAFSGLATALMPALYRSNADIVVTRILYTTSSERGTMQALGENRTDERGQKNVTWKLPDIEKTASIESLATAQASADGFLT